MRLKKWILVISIFCFLIVIPSAFAESSYVLPYPSTMPGGIAYKLHGVWEELMKFWYFGTFGQLKYNLARADKYLVEAKTLFEYKQYLLGYQALKKSDSYFSKTLLLLKKAKVENKDIGQNRKILAEAALKHMEELAKLQKVVPQDFLWQPEKSAPTQLPLASSIQSSINLRNSYYESYK